VPVFKPDDINATPVRNQLRALAPSACVVIAFGQKLGPELLDGLFAINLHASLLPRWRGAAPINAAILAGDEITGNSVITLAQRMDAGLILAQSRRPIDPATTAGELHDLLANDGPALVLGVLAQHAAGTLNAHAQDESLVTKARKLSKADALLDFARPAEDLRRQIHALTPGPASAARSAHTPSNSSASPRTHSLATTQLPAHSSPPTPPSSPAPPATSKSSNSSPTQANP
jgi:methionyl-tRNA formyltransferase